MVSRDTATPGSSNMDTGPPHKTPKDRKCPYCQEMFTSSSLGRHLDQFIKEDKPKPPDGRHNVEEIRSTRGAVTRRQARTASAKRDITAASAQTMTPDGDVSPPLKRAKLNGTKVPMWNTASLESTGVLPELATFQGSSLFGTDTKSSDIIRKQREAMQERDEGRASKLALIEILDNLVAAESQSVPSTPYPFDFLAQSFPSLVLLMLPRQPTVLSSQLIPNAKCWPIDPPGKMHYDLLRKLLSDRLDELAVERRTGRRQRDSEDSTASQSTVETRPPLDYAQYYEHLNNAYNVWTTVADSEKHRQYHLEFARAFAREQEAHAETKAKLHEAEKRIAHNENQITRLSELQQPNEFLKSPIKAQPYSGLIAKLVAGRLSTDRIPTAETLINKWRSVVESNRGWQKGFIAQLNLAAMGETELETLHNSNDAALPGTNGVDAHQTNGTDAANSTSIPALDHDGGDSVDASGEDDDEMQVLPQANARNPPGIGPMEHMIDPNLNTDTGDFGAASLLADINNKSKRSR